MYHHYINIERDKLNLCNIIQIFNDNVSRKSVTYVLEYPTVKAKQ